MTAGEQVWYCALGDGTRIGPIDERELIALAKNGKLHGNDQVWKKGWPDWSAAESVQLLTAALANHPPPLVSPPPARSHTSTSVPVPLRFKRVLRFIGWILMLLLVVSGIRFCGWYLAKERRVAAEQAVPASADGTSASDTSESDLARMVDLQNKDHPTQISDILELTRMDAGPGLQVTYQYRLLSDQFTKDMVTHEFFQGVKNDLLADKCESAKVVLDSGIMIVVSYNASDGSNLFRFPITNKDCGR